MEGLRRGLGAGAPPGSVRGGPVRWRGRASDEGPGGESAEGGGEAMVVGIVCALARNVWIVGVVVMFVGDNV